MVSALEALDGTLNTSTYALLGDTITYKPSGGSVLTFLAIAEHGDNVERLSGSGVLTGDCAVEVPVATIAEPTKTDEITLPQRPGETFLAKDWKRDESGMNWLIVLKTKPA